MDLIRDYAQPLPTTIIAEMLGVPAGDRHRFQRWSNIVVYVDEHHLAAVEGRTVPLGVHALRPQAHPSRGAPIPGMTWSAPWSRRTRPATT